MKWLFEIGRVAWWVVLATRFVHIKEMSFTPPYMNLHSFRVWKSIVVSGSLPNNPTLFVKRIPIDIELIPEVK